MVVITAQITVAAPAPAVWDAVTTWANHERWIPLTRVRILTDGVNRVGTRFVARTGLGPLSVDDVMEVTAWAPPADGLPGRWSVVKRGRIVHGGATFRVESSSASVGGTTREQSVVTWTEELALWPERLTAPLKPLLWISGRAGLVRALKIMAHELQPDAQS